MVTLWGPEACAPRESRPDEENRRRRSDHLKSETPGRLQATEGLVPRRADEVSDKLIVPEIAVRVNPKRRFRRRGRLALWTERLTAPPNGLPRPERAKR